MLYWIFTGLLAALMLLSALPNIMSTTDAVIMMSNHLGYPTYFIPFIGVAKLLGVIALLAPGFPRIKEWAYAGFTFDIMGAIYSFYAVHDPVSDWLPLFVGLILIGLSYYFHHKRLKGKAAVSK